MFYIREAPPPGGSGYAIGGIPIAAVTQHRSGTASRTGRDNRNENGNPQGDHEDVRSDNLRDSPTMARILDALEKGEDVGHFGRLVFAMVARHFMGGDAIVDLLARQPDQDETKARAMLTQVQEHDYNPPRRDRILAWQSQQDFQMVDPDDPGSGNLYRELRFPDDIYDNIQDYYEEQAEGTAQGA